MGLFCIRLTPLDRPLRSAHWRVAGCHPALPVAVLWRLNRSVTRTLLRAPPLWPLNVLGFHRTAPAPDPGPREPIGSCRSTAADLAGKAAAGPDGPSASHRRAAALEIAYDVGSA